MGSSMFFLSYEHNIMYSSQVELRGTNNATVHIRIHETKSAKDCSAIEVCRANETETVTFGARAVRYKCNTWQRQEVNRVAGFHVQSYTGPLKKTGNNTLRTADWQDTATLLIVRGS